MARPPRSTLLTLNAWRGLFAVFIVLFHYYPSGHFFDQLTWAGVSFFLVAAGFLNAMHHGDMACDGASWRRFIKRRAMRLYPLHWLALALVVALGWIFGRHTPAPLTLALNATLLQAWVPVRDIYLSFNAPSWFLSSLLFCYVLTPPLLAFLRRSERGFVVLTALLMVAMAVACPLMDVERIDFMYFFPPARLIDFMLGMCVYRLTTRRRTIAVSHGALEVGAIALLALTIALHRLVPALWPWENVVLWWLPVAVILWVAKWTDGHEGPVGRLMRCRPLQWLGNVSFELYLFQTVAMSLVTLLVLPFFAHWGLLLHDYGRPLALLLLLALAGALHRLSRRSL